MNDAEFGEPAANDYEDVAMDEDTESIEDSLPAADVVELTARQEIEALLEDDESRLGDVYRLHVLEALAPQEVADRLNVATVGFVYGYKSRIDAILDGKVTTGATLQTQVTAAVRSFVKRSRAQVSAAAAQLLVSHLALAEQALAELTSSETSVEEPPRGDDADVDAGHLDGKPGIYAFSYGWYLEKPVDERSGNTLIKVGQTSDVGSRIRQHRGGARAHMPEPLVVVRVYTAGDSDPAVVEKQFHRLLSTAGHNNPRRASSRRANEVGQEWFLTNETFLDAIASVLNLRTEFIGRSAFVE
ncbi:GIY-YIG nuclease family protein [Microbacterium sp. BH-3-3-3]|uniref:GIY-YIG nuclease family protein n=1 Tax=Microbacterium sp. BH-3-3-3 TaxID=1906742 RepID=UPI0021B56CF2|nr:GIY-YIG nuclease family protein [Microbacterium sp. BH-3-3-3]